MLEAAFWGALASSSLVIAAEITFRARLGRVVIGLAMAFGVGALISSVSFELIEPASEAEDLWQIALALGAGSLTFFAGDRMIARLTASSSNRGDSQSGLGVVLGTVLDGIPESAVLGMSLVTGNGVSAALLAGIFASNMPESLASTIAMHDGGMRRTTIRMIWWGTVFISGVAAALGFALVDGQPSFTGALMQAFAAGALLTMIADELAPEAYDRSALYSGPATAAGFLVAFFLTSFEA